MKRLIADQGSAAWQTTNMEFGLFSLGRSRDWAAIASLYERRPPRSDEICARNPALSPLVGMALIKQGRKKDADKFLSCVRVKVTALLKMRFRSPDEAPGELEASQAGLLALRNDGRALDWLGKAVERGWLGQYFSSQLADWPQFDNFKSDPRYAALQQRIDATVSRERRAVLTGSR